MTLLIQDKYSLLTKRYEEDGYKGVRTKTIFKYYGTKATEELLIMRQLKSACSGYQSTKKIREKQKEIFNQLSYEEQQKILIENKKKNQEKYKLFKNDNTKQEISKLTREMKKLERQINNFRLKQQQIPLEIIEQYHDIKSILTNFQSQNRPFLQKKTFNSKSIIKHIM